jgi:hypothetical protein
LAAVAAPTGQGRPFPLVPRGARKPARPERTTSMSLTSTYANTPVEAQFDANSFGLVDQLAPTVLGLSTGGIAVAYNNHDSADGYMMVDFYDSGFNRIGTYQDRVPFVGDTMAIGQPALTETSSGNVVLMWEEGDQGGIKGRTFSSAGTILSPEFTYGGGGLLPGSATGDAGERQLHLHLRHTNQADLTAADFVVI